MDTKEIVKQSENSPAEMIKAAVNSGADLDKLEKLLSLQERWEANEARKAYHRAMADFKSENIEIDKDREVAYGNTKYSHATLANVVKTITKGLSKHGLSATWKTDQTDKKISVTCKITHVMGHSEDTTLSADPDTSGSKNSIQAIGSTITYLERYTLLAATGLATAEQDDDAKGAEVFIGDKELHALRDELLSRDLSEKKLIEYLGIAKLQELKMSDFQKAKNAIKSARKVEKK